MNKLQRKTEKIKRKSGTLIKKQKIKLQGRYYSGFGAWSDAEVAGKSGNGHVSTVHVPLDHPVAHVLILGVLKTSLKQIRTDAKGVTN